MGDRTDVVVVGAGPAGLATAIAAATAGLATVVCERATAPPDKACGEGLMPAGLRALAALGARDLIAAEECAPIDGICYVQEDGGRAAADLPAPGGLGIRRTALAGALARRAAACGVELRWGCAAEGFTTAPGAVTLRTGAGELTAGVLVAADGLHSRLRRAAGLEVRTGAPPRFGLRQHLRVPPWSRRVEVHLARGVEAFVTPAGAGRVGVAFLWEKDRIAGPVSFARLLERFPAVAERIAGAPADSQPRGAGPLAQAVRARTADRFALVGDAAGYVDAITGEGLSLALECGRALGEGLPLALARGATRAALAPYERFAAHEFRRYAVVCRTVLGLARRPLLRRGALRILGRHPRLFDRLVALSLA
ncbi:MAG: NAD(P)/FAD-dependent oxidoreductase [Acidobacteria bacterium]|nr:MAG: NAD(P)/FAD-dependent oxidoreductase [Acidobacteriota bacterium]